MKRILILLSFLLVGCASRPTIELILAEVAVKAAEKAKADSLATDLYRQAENNYIRAKKDFKAGYFDSCRSFAKEARMSAEKAEYKALLKQAQIRSGAISK